MFNEGEIRMDLKKFGGFVLLLGVALLAYGILIIATNQGVSFDSSKSRRDPIFGRMDLEQALNANQENQRRAARRSESTTYFIIGGIVCFVGYAMRSSATSGRQNQGGNVQQTP
jgi:hypothetical protein